MPTFVNDFDDRLKSRLLRGSYLRREPFDPANDEHRASLKKFIESGNWGAVQFYAEFPYITVPETVLRKFAAYNLERLA